MKIDSNTQRKDFMFRNLQILDAFDFELSFTDLESPYCKLTRDRYRHEEFITEPLENRTLATQLQEVQYLTSYTMES